MEQAIALFLPLLFTACGSDSTEGSRTQDEPVGLEFNVPDSSYVILDYSDEWYWLFEGAKAEHLSREDLAQAELLIEKAVMESNEQQRAALEDHNRKHPDEARSETGYELDLPRFKRQYVSVTNSAGQHEVWVRFFCDGGGLVGGGWKTNPLIVQDGGNCYFSLKVNLDTNTYSDLSINGYA